MKCHVMVRLMGFQTFYLEHWHGAQEINLSNKTVTGLESMFCLFGLPIIYVWENTEYSMHMTTDQLTTDTDHRTLTTDH